MLFRVGISQLHSRITTKPFVIIINHYPQNKYFYKYEYLYFRASSVSLSLQTSDVILSSWPTRDQNLFPSLNLAPIQTNQICGSLRGYRLDFNKAPWLRRARLSSTTHAQHSLALLWFRGLLINWYQQAIRLFFYDLTLSLGSKQVCINTYYNFKDWSNESCGTDR